MAEREQIRKPAPTPREQTVEESPPATERSSELKEQLDDLLDEIDEVLETNAEDFVKSYIQKGGE